MTPPGWILFVTTFFLYDIRTKDEKGKKHESHHKRNILEFVSAGRERGPLFLDVGRSCGAEARRGERVRIYMAAPVPCSCFLFLFPDARTKEQEASPGSDSVAAGDLGLTFPC